MRRLLLVPLLVASLSAAAHAGGKARARTVIDRTVGGKVVKRTVVTGSLPRKAGKPVTLERELAAMRKGWSVTAEEAPEPADLTLKGRLVESGFRAQRGGQSIIKLERPGGQHLKGEEEIRIYSGGKLTRVKRLGKVAGREVTGGAPARGTGRAVSARFDDAEILTVQDGAATWSPIEPLAFRYDPSDPYAVVFDVAQGNQWLFARDLLADALAYGRSGDQDVTMRATDRHLEIKLSTAAGSATLRVPRAAAVAFLVQSQSAVPRGSEGNHMDLDGELRRILDQP